MDSTDWVGDWTSLAFNSRGNPSISYRYAALTSYDLRYAHWNGSSWKIEMVDKLLVEHISLAFDSGGNPAIAYYAYAPDRDLKYASFNGVSWDVQTVDSTGDVGEWASLAFDASGNPAISYFDATDLNLKFARWNGSSWDIETVDKSSEVGEYASLAFDSSGNPGISYYDSTNKDLMYAYADVTPPATPMLVSPANGAEVSITTTTFDWSDIVDTSEATYRLEVDNNPDFSSPMVSKQGLGYSNFTLSAGDALSQGIYYWRVKAIDGANNESAWSSSWSFNVDTAPSGFFGLPLWVWAAIGGIVTLMVGIAIGRRSARRGG